jgi:D-sedoheptulose 7-phosphate isomerase
MTYTSSFLNEAKAIIDGLDQEAIENIINGLVKVRSDGGRLFILGAGGGAGHASHAVNDFRKICDIESYAPSDNVSELTARINDDGWDTAYSKWLEVSRIRKTDAVLVFSVGGGNAAHNVSMSIVNALKLAQSVGASIYGIVGRDGGYTREAASACVLVPSFDTQTVTPQVEAFQAVVWHLIVSHPSLVANPMKWETITEQQDK